MSPFCIQYVFCGIWTESLNMISLKCRHEVLRLLYSSNLSKFMLGPKWVRCWRGEWCVRPGSKNPKGSKMDGKMNILNKNFDSLRSANFKLFGRMKGNTVNDDFFKDHYFSYWRPFWLFTPGVKNRSYTSAGSHFPRFMWCMLFLAGRDGRTVNSDELPVNPICEGMWKHACVPHWASWKHLSHHRKLLSV